MTISTAVRSASPPRVLGVLTAAATLPYLALKTIWLAGGTAGVRDGALLADPSVRALNGVTLVLDLLVVALAILLTVDAGLRLPAWTLLLPIWVGTGFLLPMAVAILPSTLVGSLGADTGPFEPWVQPMVYGGFAVQGLGLAIAFALYAARRWGEVVAAPAAVPPGLWPLLRVLVGGGVAAAALSGALHLAGGLVSGSGDGVLMALAKAGFAAAGAVGVLHLARGPGGHRWTAAVAAWIGTGAMFAWGLWSAALTMADTALAAPDPIGGPADLAGLLAGLALATAALAALSGSTMDAGAPRHGVAGRPPSRQILA